ncbi:MAG: 2-C-methyl-D-erythritol 2,4-cyclodiphosphate synthase [Candidatus Diapherotrites archaeon]|nr:2-C-methyl-D-erythritol 2,4-cyclodiphosphate synthase [Candidatus Diapherotrites archaeon]
MYRIGIGIDSHRIISYKAEKPLILAGVKFDEKFSLKANSDGDVVLHALFNAISSALGLYSISRYADEMCKKGITDSREYVKVILQKMHEKGFSVENVAIALECKRPKIEPKVEEMKAAIAKLCGISKERVAITATSGEQLSAFGKGEGIYCIASCLLKKE